MKKKLWILSFLLFLFFFASPIFLKGQIIGPFDFLVGFYDPFREIKWSNNAFFDTARHYKNYLMSDVVVVVLPVKLLAINYLKALQLPLWNPYILNGSPLLSNVQSAIFYPLNILYFIFDAPSAFNIYILAQPLLGFIFMFLFLRSLQLDRYSSYFGALSFSFSAFFIVWLPWGTLAHAFLWLPLALFSINKYFLTKKKRYGLIFVASLTLSFFAGHTQTTLVVFGISLIYLLIKYFQLRNQKVFFALLGLFALTFLLTAVQLLPTMEMYRESVRDVVSTQNFYKDQTLNFSSFLMAPFPDFFGNPVTRNWWGKMNYAESAIYFGTVSLFFSVFALLKRRTLDPLFFHFLAGLLIVGIFLSTQNFLSYFVFKLHLPVLSSSAFARYGMIFIFAGTVLSALGFNSFLQDIKKGQLKAMFINSGIFVFSLALFWVLIIGRKLPPEFLNNLSIIKRNVLLPTALLVITVTVTLLSLWFSKRYKKLRPKLQLIVPPVLIVLLSLELFRFSHKYVPFSPRAFFFPPHAVSEKLQALAKDARFSGYFPINTNSYYEIKSVGGGEPLYNKRLAQLAILGKGIDAKITDRTGLEIPDGPNKARILDLLSVKYFIDKTDNFRNSWISINGSTHEEFDKRFKEVWKDDLFKIYENTYAVPEAHIYHKAEYYGEAARLFGRLISKDFNPKDTVLVEKKHSALSTLDTSAGRFTIKKLNHSPNRQNYAVSSSKPGILAVTETYYPGWNAYVDNTKQELIAVNHAFRGVFVPKGEHRVTFSYEPTSVKRGVLLTMCGLLLLGLWFVFG